MNVTSSNLANAQTTRTAEGGPYRRKDAVFEAVPQREFASVFQGQMDTPLTQSKVVDVDIRYSRRLGWFTSRTSRCNAEGMVAYPNINTMEEMVEPNHREPYVRGQRQGTEHFCTNDEQGFGNRKEIINERHRHSGGQIRQ